MGSATQIGDKLAWIRRLDVEPSHWGINDPAAVEGSDEARLRAFRTAYRELDARIKIFASLRIDQLDQLSLQRRLDEIGHMRNESVLE
jgi:arsenate reductase